MARRFLWAHSSRAEPEEQRALGSSQLLDELVARGRVLVDRGQDLGGDSETMLLLPVRILSENYLAESLEMHFLYAH